MSDRYAVMVQVKEQGAKPIKEDDYRTNATEQRTISLKTTGSNNSSITAQVAALGVIRILDAGSGLYFCEDLLDIDDLGIQYEVYVI